MVLYPSNILEEELKNRVASDWFGSFDCEKIVGHVDFCASLGMQNFVWAEAKKGTTHNIYDSFVQLILTIGKERTFDNNLPPKFLCAFDAGRIAFIEYNRVLDIFYQNDFNWNVAPSDHTTKEFQQLKARAIDVLEEEKYLFDYDEDAEELREFIAQIETGESPKIRIDKNNFIHVYLRWYDKVKPTIAINWDVAKEEGFVDTDFFLAELILEDGFTVLEKIAVQFNKNHYLYNKTRKATGALSFDRVDFNDNQKAYNEFWKIYERPPREEYWGYIFERRDLLVPQDIRERKGSFFTPRAWVELSQRAIAEELGEDWQDQYYIWDCCAGTGNLLLGLNNPYRIFASTIDNADVDVMYTMIDRGRNMLHEHVFQFDFLNDPFDKKNALGQYVLPQTLRDVISDPEKRKKLVIYMNPPYAEATTARTVTGTGENKSGVATEHLANQKYKPLIGNAANEVFALFLIRIYKEIPGAMIAHFSTLKALKGRNFTKFRDVFECKLKRLFLLPADTFDNVKGQFPIGFHIWLPQEGETFKRISATVYDKKGKKIGKKIIRNLKKHKSINQWWVRYKSKKAILALISNYPPDFQNQNKVCILSKPYARYCHNITSSNIIPFSVYFAVRHCSSHTWLNDRDQFLEPKRAWLKDLKFHYDCLAYALFHRQNRVSSKDGVNHFIPFCELDVRPKTEYKSHFLLDFLAGKIQMDTAKELFEQEQITNEPAVFSTEAQAVMDSAREIYKYYHSKVDSDTNASFYDIRLYFQGADNNGRMNVSSSDETYNSLLKKLRISQRILAKKIEEKASEYEFLE